MEKDDKSLLTSPQLAIREQNRVVVALSSKQILSIYKKSESSNIPFDTLREVYERGYAEDLSEQTAFNRVNSFIAGGAAAEMDKDLLEVNKSTGGLKKACWKGYTAIGLKKKNGHTVPNCVPEDYTGAEPTTTNMEDPASRFVGTTQLTDTYKKMTPGYEKSTLKTIKKVVKEQLDIQESETWQKTKYKNPEGGMTKAGVMAYRREHPGSKLQTAVTTKPSNLKKGSKAANRRKSFCARMGGAKGPMKDEKGRPTRKALALRKWNC